MSPLVTLAIVTRDRPRLLKQALFYASRQTYANCEVVVVDDGPVDRTEQVKAWCPSLPVRYTNTTPATIGRNRNLAAGASQAKYIAHWDDDDWYPPDRIERQVALLERTEKGITGVPSCYVYDIPSRRASTTRLDGNVQGHTLFYRRELHLIHPFWDINVGEDQQFFHLNAGHRAVEEDFAMVVYMFHSKNVTGKRPFDWTATSAEHVRGMLGADAAFYDAFGADLVRLGGAAHAIV